MNRFRQMLPMLITAVVVVLILWWGYGRFYRGPIESLQSEIADARSDVDKARDMLRNNPALEDRMAEIVNRTLGGNEETIDDALRSRLNAIVSAIGLNDATVGTGRSSAKDSPARRAFPRSGSWRALRDELDFVEREGFVSAEGSFEQVVALIDRIMAEPWMKRIDQVRLDQKDNGARYGVTVRLTTLYIPGRSPDEDAGPEPYPQERMERFASLVGGSPFRVPPPPPPPPAPEPEPKPDPTPAPPPGPPPFPWQEWVLTGVAAGREGPEAWLRNASSGETRILRPGGRIGDAELASANGDSVVLVLDDARFRVLVGNRLSDRTPLAD